MATISWERNEGITSNTAKLGDKRGELYTPEGVAHNTHYLLSMGRAGDLLTSEEKMLRQCGGSFNNGAQAYIKPHFTEPNFSQQIRSISKNWADSNIERCLASKKSNSSIKIRKLPRVIAKRFTLSFKGEELLHFKNPEIKAFWIERLTTEVLEKLTGLNREYQIQPHLEKSNQPHVHCQFMCIDLDGYNYSVHKDGERLNQIMAELERKYQYILDPVTNKPVVDSQGGKIPFLIQQSGDYKAKLEVKKFVTEIGQKLEPIEELLDEMSKSNGVANYSMLKGRLGLRGFDITRPGLNKTKAKNKPVAYISSKYGVGTLPIDVFSGDRKFVLMREIDAEYFKNETGINLLEIDKEITSVIKSICETTNITDFSQSLEMKGIEFKPVIKNNQVTGGSFIKDGHSIKMSWLSHNCHWKNIKEKLAYYPSDIEQYRLLLINTDEVNSNKKALSKISGIYNRSTSLTDEFAKYQRLYPRTFLTYNGVVQGRDIINLKTGRVIFSVNNDGVLSSSNTSLAVAKAKVSFLIAQGAPSIKIVTGNDEYRKNIWLACQLSAKDILLNNYSPNGSDLKFLEGELQKRRAEYDKRNNEAIQRAVNKYSNPLFRQTRLVYQRVDTFGKYDSYITAIKANVAKFTNYTVKEQLDDYTAIMNHCRDYHPKLCSKVEEHLKRIDEGHQSSLKSKDTNPNRQPIASLNALLAVDMLNLKRTAPEIYEKAQAFLKLIADVDVDGSYGLKRAKYHIEYNPIFEDFRCGGDFTSELLIQLNNKVLNDMKRTRQSKAVVNVWLLLESPIADMLKHIGASEAQIKGILASQVAKSEFKPKRR